MSVSVQRGFQVVVAIGLVSMTACVEDVAQHSSSAAPKADKPNTELSQTSQTTGTEKKSLWSDKPEQMVRQDDAVASFQNKLGKAAEPKPINENLSKHLKNFKENNKNNSNNASEVASTRKENSNTKTQSLAKDSARTETAQW